MFGFVLEPDCFLTKKTDPPAVLITGLQLCCVSKHSLNTAMHQLLTAVIFFGRGGLLFFPMLEDQVFFFSKL